MCVLERARQSEGERERAAVNEGILCTPLPVLNRERRCEAPNEKERKNTKRRRIRG